MNNGVATHAQLSAFSIRKSQVSILQMKFSVTNNERMLLLNHLTLSYWWSFHHIYLILLIITDIIRCCVTIPVFIFDFDNVIVQMISIYVMFVIFLPTWLFFEFIHDQIRDFRSLSSGTRKCKYFICAVIWYFVKLNMLNYNKHRKSVSISLIKHNSEMCKYLINSANIRDVKYKVIAINYTSSKSVDSLQSLTLENYIEQQYEDKKTTNSNSFPLKDIRNYSCDIYQNNASYFSFYSYCSYCHCFLPSISVSPKEWLYAKICCVFDCSYELILLFLKYYSHKITNINF